MQGDVPAYVQFLARRYPVALKVFRARYESVLAQAFGVTKGQAFHALANAQRYVGDMFADAVFEPIAGLFEDWD